MAARNHQANTAFSDSEMDRLNALGLRLGLDRADLIRHAITALAFATERRDAGNAGTKNT